MSRSPHFGTVYPDLHRLHNGQLVVIDVSQSVEHDHPKSMEFLRHDIKNITQYFRRQAGDDLLSLSIRKAWEFIVSPTAGEESSGKDWQDRYRSMVLKHLEDADPPETENDGTTHGESEGVFMNAFILQTLAEIRDPETEIRGSLATNVRRLVVSELGPISIHKTADREDMEQPEGAISDDEEEEEESDREEKEATDEKTPRGFRHEDKDDKRVSAVATDRSWTLSLMRYDSIANKRSRRRSG